MGAAWAGSGDFLTSAAGPGGDSRWSYQFGLSTRLGLTADFRNIGQWDSPNAVSGFGSVTNRTYDDGFNRVDFTGNIGGLTSHWGIRDLDQVGQVAPNTISMNLNNSLSNGSLTGVDDDSPGSPGIEYTLQYQMGRLGTLVGLDRSPVTWGFGLNFFYQNVGIGGGGQTLSDVERVTDSFASGSVAIGVAPYSGPSTPAFGAPLISDNLTMANRATSIIPNGAMVQGSYDLSTNLFGVNVGPWVQVPITNKLAFNAEAGLSLALAFSDFKGSSTTTIAGSGSQTHKLSDDSTELLIGAYLGAGLRYEISESMHSYLSLRWNTMQDHSVDAGRSKAELDFSSNVSISAGVGFKF